MAHRRAPVRSRARQAVGRATRWWNNPRWLAGLNLFGTQKHYPEQNIPFVLSEIYSAFNGGRTTVTVPNVSISSGSAKIYVAVHSIDPTIGDRTVSAVTHGGQALTLVAGSAIDHGLSGKRIEIWELNDPVSGPASVVVTMGGSCTGIFAMAFFVDRFGAEGDVSVQNDSNGPHQFDVTLSDLSTTIFVTGVNLTTDLDETNDLESLHDIISGANRLHLSVFSKYPGGTVEDVGWQGGTSGTIWLSAYIELEVHPSL